MSLMSVTENRAKATTATTLASALSEKMTLWLYI
jgi:hypothetical protein